MRQLVIVLSVFIFSLGSGLLGCMERSQNQYESVEVNEGTASGIIGGEVASDESRVSLSTVGIVLKEGDKPQSFCSGTLISKNLVLTAIHCLRDLKPEMVRVVVGVDLPESFQDPRVMGVQAWREHPEYDFYFYDQYTSFTSVNDIAVIRLSEDVKPPFRSVPILSQKAKLKKGMRLLLAGYGITSEAPGASTASSLYVTSVKFEKMWQKMLVTNQTSGRGACRGDSGGPAYIESSQGLILVGVTRGGHGKSKTCHEYGEYTHAARSEAFIMKAAEELQGEPPIFN